MLKANIKKIAIIGSGIVGQATGKGMLDVGHQVVFYDTNPVIVSLLLKSGFEAKNVLDLLDEKSHGFDFFMISVPTPTKNNKVDLSYLESALHGLGKVLQNNSKNSVVVIRSTISPGTTENMAISILEKASGKKAGKNFGVCMNPEFLREISAEEDFRNPWMVVIGSDDKKAAVELGKLYAPFKSPVSYMSLKEAEMLKYVHNLLNATKISFFNEMRVVGNSIGADPDVIFPAVVKSAEAIWNPAYGTKNLGPYSGKCLPKDTKAFYTWAAEKLGYETPVLKGTIQTNELIKTIYEYYEFSLKESEKYAKSNSLGSPLKFKEKIPEKAIVKKLNQKESSKSDQLEGLQL